MTRPGAAHRLVPTSRRLEQQLLFGGRHGASRRADRVGIHGDRGDAEPDEMFRELRPVGRRLTAQRGREAMQACALHDLTDGVDDGWIALVEELAAHRRIMVHAQDELCQVVRADRHTMDAEAGVVREPVHD